ncbi:MAG: SUMF1/EgtB/PvdO family nonheme iron enzyme [Oligoflexales bacterium]
MKKQLITNIQSFNILVISNTYIFFTLISCASINQLFFSNRYCPEEMSLVSDSNRKINICVDKFEFTLGEFDNIENKKPLTAISYFECQKLCDKNGKRMLTHDEWQAACQETDHTRCNKFKSNHNLTNGALVKNCKKNDKCLEDSRFDIVPISLAENREFDSCVSKYGVHHMIGNLGEWVLDLRRHKGKTFGRVNGGFYSEKLSNCSFTNITHDPRFKNYSIGCRCAVEPFHFVDD